MSYWTDQAAKLPQKQLTPFGQLLKKQLRVNHHDLYRDLLKKGDLSPFLLVQQEQAKDSLEQMISQGTAPDLAREQVLNDLMASLEPVAQAQPEEQEAEDSVAESALSQWLRQQTPA